MKVDPTNRSVDFHAIESVGPSRHRHADLFTREGEYWTISSGSGLFRLRHSKGLGYVARLLQEPGARFHASLLAGKAGSAEAGPPQAERDRVNVTKSIKAAVKRIGEHDPDLAEHLHGSIKTGIFCTYLPGRIRIED